MSYVKHLVSKKKRRFIDDDFDLDLAYIKPNIVAMGFPSENLEGVYRNHLDDVQRFLELKHKGKYKVYNLCSEKSYDPAKFEYRVSVFGFDDHNAPPFKLILPYCMDMDDWLSTEDNVAIVHCKAGKGRTGVMICSYLLYKKYFTSAIDAMNYYADARTQNKKGVTIPSQRRYITYFGFFAKNGFKYVERTALLNSITFIGVPAINSGTCSPSLIICQTKVILHKSRTIEVRKTQAEIEMDIGSNPIPICGDIKIDVFHKDLFKKERMLVFWFNTHFLELGVTLSHPDGEGITELGQDKYGNRIIQYEIPQQHLDKANKDKKHKFYPESFKVRLNITIPRPTTTSEEINAKRSMPDTKDGGNASSKGPFNKDSNRELSKNAASLSKGAPNTRDVPSLTNITEEKVSAMTDQLNKDTSHWDSNVNSNDSHVAASRYYINTSEHPRLIDTRNSSRGRNATSKTLMSPETLGSVNKDICASMEALQVEDADHLSSSDDDDEEEFL